MADWLVTAMIVAAPFVVLLVVLVLVLRYRRRVWGRLYASTGLVEWYEVARGQPRSDRWKVARANARGRATEPRLAPAAVRRAEVMIAVNQKNARWGYMRWVVVFCGVLQVFNVAVQVWSLSTGSRGNEEWALLAFHLALLVFWVALVASWRRLSDRTERRLRESLRRNRELLEQDPP